MKQYYESEVLFQLMERDGLNIPSSVPPYEAEIKAYLINQVKQAYPKLTDYEAEWLLYNYTKHLPAEFPISSVSDVTEATFENVVPFAYQSATLKGSTKYRDIDTGDILDMFDETKNLELVSVKMPVLTTSNEDGTKTNILTVNEEVELRGIGDVQDTLDCLTGKVTERVGEIVLDGSDDENWIKYSSADTTVLYCVFLDNLNRKIGVDNVFCDRFITKNTYINDTDKESIFASSINQATYIRINKNKIASEDVNGLKTWLSQNPITIQYQLETESIKSVDLTTVNEKGETTYFMPLEGTMSVQSSGEIIKPTFDMSVPIEAITQNLASFIDLEMEE